MPFPDRRLYLLFTPALCRNEPAATLRAALRGGVDLVQWRVPAADDAGFRRCRDICADHHVPVVVNDDIMLAVRGNAHGGHVGQDDMPAVVARRLLEHRWLGISTHTAAQIETAVRDGADYVGFGPCFPTATKGYESGLPTAEIEAAAANCPLPLFAIGGITAARLPELLPLGIRRIAVSRAILAADDPAAAAEELRRQLWS